MAKYYTDTDTGENNTAEELRSAYEQYKDDMEETYDSFEEYLESVLNAGMIEEGRYVWAIFDDQGNNVRTLEAVTAGAAYTECKEYFGAADNAEGFTLVRIKEDNAGCWTECAEELEAARLFGESKGESDHEQPKIYGQLFNGKHDIQIYPGCA